MRKLFLTLLVLLIPSSAWAQGRDILECFQEKTVVGTFLQDIIAATNLAEDPSYQPPRSPYSELEERIIAALRGVSGTCPARLLSAELKLGEPPAPGFASGREKAYETALRLYEKYGYLFQDERACASCDTPDDGRTWTASELARLEVTMNSVGNWTQGLPIQQIIRRKVDCLDPEGWASYRQDELSFGGNEIGISDRVHSKGPGCMESGIVHEMFHAYTANNPLIMRGIAKKAGWTFDANNRATPPPSYGRFAAEERYQRYHMTNWLEDSIERATFFALGQTVEGLSGSDCAFSTVKHRPKPNPEAVAFMQRFIPVNAPLLEPPPAIDGVTLGVTTTAEFTSGSRTFTSVESHDRVDRWRAVDYYYWTPEGGNTEWFAVFRDGRALGVGSNIAERQLTRETLVRDYGEPSIVDGDRLVWADRLLSIEMGEDGFAQTVTYGFLLRYDPKTSMR